VRPAALSYEYWTKKTIVMVKNNQVRMIINTLTSAIDTVCRSY